ncbi:MAG: phosphatidylserine decarboxylase [Planctomycetota bacterium]|nr:phosphatidylserine decarboxylase [Planctomycetota bacterium]
MENSSEISSDRTITGRTIEPLDSQIHCIQPGGGVCMRLEWIWGSVRRCYLKVFRRGYLKRIRTTRQGEVNQCPWEVLDPRDLKFHVNQQGYYWEPRDDPFQWRERLPFVRAGLAELLIFSMVLIPVAGALIRLAVLQHSGWWVAAAIPILLEAEVVWFFRNPRRQIPQDAGLVVSPADGKVDLIEELDHDDVIQGPAVKIAIFLSVFNVHINRSPITATIFGSGYRQGKFLSALKPESAWENERLELWLEGTEAPHRVMRLRQITGQLARRIVCRAKPGDVFERGEPYGMIKLGSRTELILPREDSLQLKVSVGDKVKAGCSIMALYDE